MFFDNRFLFKIRFFNKFSCYGTVTLKKFLKTEISNLIFINFLRFKSKFKSLFQYTFEYSGTRKYILLERMFEYEHTSRYNAFETRDHLLKEIDGDDFHLSPIQGKIVLNDIERILELHAGKNLNEIELEIIKTAGTNYQEIIGEMFVELKDFIHIDPKIPGLNKEYIETEKLTISHDDTRDKILTKILKLSKKSETSLLALYVYRDMDTIDWITFIKAAVERNPVCFTDLEGKTVEEVYDIIQIFPDLSIYDGRRLALPDEVWNFRHGDGIEKALLLADFMLHLNASAEIVIDISNKKALLTYAGKSYHFISRKGFKRYIRISGREYSVTENKPG